MKEIILQRAREIHESRDKEPEKWWRSVTDPEYKDAPLAENKTTVPNSSVVALHEILEEAVIAWANEYPELWDRLDKVVFGMDCTGIAAEENRRVTCTDTDLSVFDRNNECLICSM